jgi:hypothetical protein
VGWTIRAEGQIPGTHEHVEAIERELNERLREVLSDPKFGTLGATLSGDEILCWPDEPKSAVTTPGHPDHRSRQP